MSTPAPLVSMPSSPSAPHPTPPDYPSPHPPAPFLRPPSPPASIGRWDTVQTSPPALHGNPHTTPWIGGTYGVGAGWRAFPAASCYTANGGTANGIGAAAPALLAVDVMQLAEDRGFPGGLAAVVECSGGCTYQVVLDGGGGGGGGGEGGWGGGRGAGRINVHVSRVDGVFFRTICLFSLSSLWPLGL